MQIDRRKLSPMMQQYFEVKDKYQDHILFFRLGDFYEMFFDDAIKISKALELTLTGRDCGLPERAPMCGIPFHSADVYIKRLIAMGERVAICEQMEDPRAVKGIVKRDVIRIVTPGTLTESSLLDDASNNYIACVFAEQSRVAVCYTDISTGAVELYIYNDKPLNQIESELINEISRYNPSELLFNDTVLDFKELHAFIKERMNISCALLTQNDYSIQLRTAVLLKQFSLDDIDDLRVPKDDVTMCCLCGMFYYISDTQKAAVGRFTQVNVHENKGYMELDLNARRNLELTETLRNKEKKGSLLWVIDKTQTSMGKRLLKNYIEQPLVNPAQIIDRLNAVENLTKDSVKLSELMDMLSGVYDLERLMTRVVYKTATPRDIKSLSLTALKMPDIKALLNGYNASLLVKLNSKVHELYDISSLVENAIIDEPPALARDGGMIKEGFNEELDRLRNIISNAEGIITGIEQREKETTGIKSLKVNYN